MIPSCCYYSSFFLHHEVSTSTEADHNRWPFLTSHNVKTQLLSMTPIPVAVMLSKQVKICRKHWYVYQVWLQAWDATFIFSATPFFFWPEGNTFRRFCLSAIDLLLLIGSFSASHNQLLFVPVKQGFHFIGSGLLSIIAHYSALHGQKPHIYNSNYYKSGPDRDLWRGASQ